MNFIKIWFQMIVFAVVLVARVSSAQSLAPKGEGSVGNGGDVVECEFAEDNDFKGLYSLDYLVSRIGYEEQDALIPVLDGRKSLEGIQKYFEEKVPSWARPFREFRETLLKKNSPELNRFWTEAPYGLVDLKDEKLILKLPPNCLVPGTGEPRIYQAIRRKAMGKRIRYSFDPEIVTKLEKSAPLQFSFLMVHEFLWDKVGDVEFLRELNGFLHSTKRSEFNIFQLSSWLKDQGAEAEDARWIYSSYYKSMVDGALSDDPQTLDRLRKLLAPNEAEVDAYHISQIQNLFRDLNRLGGDWRYHDWTSEDDAKFNLEEFRAKITDLRVQIERQIWAQSEWLKATPFHFLIVRHQNKSLEYLLNNPLPELGKPELGSGWLAIYSKNYQALDLLLKKGWSYNALFDFVKNSDKSETEKRDLIRLTFHALFKPWLQRATREDFKELKKLGFPFLDGDDYEIPSWILNHADLPTALDFLKELSFDLKTRKVGFLEINNYHPANMWTLGIFSRSRYIVNVAAESDIFLQLLLECPRSFDSLQRLKDLIQVSGVNPRDHIYPLKSFEFPDEFAFTSGGFRASDASSNLGSLSFEEILDEMEFLNETSRRELKELLTKKRD
jgi:hypothetical protein